jgi:glycosyltransferase involved in cell wall biosynthesis
MNASDLPAPPWGRRGWPWTARSVTGSRSPSGDGCWPRLTIVTPSFQQADFLEQSIRSVLLQGYPDLEYIILDGGSTDGSVEIIRRYSSWLHFWRSHTDEGHAAAIREGWDRGTGDIVAYLNADDVYLPGSVHTAVNELLRLPSSLAVCGGELRIDESDRILGVIRPSSGALDSLLSLNYLPQPALFLRRSALRAVGGLDTSYPLNFDYELWLRVAAAGEIRILPQVLAATREHPHRISATRRAGVAREMEKLRSHVSAGSYGGLTPRQRKLARAHLAYGAASVYADSLPRGVLRVVRLLAEAVADHPPLAGRLARDASRRVLRRLGADRAHRPVLASVADAGDEVAFFGANHST